MSPGDLKGDSHRLLVPTAKLVMLSLTFCLSSSVLASLLTLAHGKSLGHHGGRVDSLPQPGFPLPVEYFNIRGMKALSCAWVIFSTGVGIPSTTRGGNSCSDGSSLTWGGACCANAVSSSCIIRVLQWRTWSRVNGQSSHWVHRLEHIPHSRGVAHRTLWSYSEVFLEWLSERLLVGRPELCTHRWLLSASCWRVGECVVTTQKKEHRRADLSKRVCCLFLMDGLVSNEWGLFRFFAVAIAAAAATPMGPLDRRQTKRRIEGYATDRRLRVVLWCRRERHRKAGLRHRTMRFLAMMGRRWDHRHRRHLNDSSPPLLVSLKVI